MYMDHNGIKLENEKMPGKSPTIWKLNKILLIMQRSRGSYK